MAGAHDVAPVGDVPGVGAVAAAGEEEQGFVAPVVEEAVEDTACFARRTRRALADRRVEDAGLVAELPAGWSALRGENPFVSRPGARLVVAQPAISALGAVSVAVRPRQMDDLDAHLDELLQNRLPRVPSQKEGERSDVQLGKGRGRLVRTTWEDGLVPMQGALVAWADGYDLFSLEAWAPAAAGDAFRAEVDALCRGIVPKGALSARIDEGVERVAIEVPELSREALRSGGRALEPEPRAGRRAVGRPADGEPRARRPGAMARSSYFRWQCWARPLDAPLGWTAG